MLQSIARVQVLLSLAFTLSACNSQTGPSWVPIPGASILPPAVTMGEGDEVEFVLVNVPPGAYTWSLGNTRDTIEYSWRLGDNSFAILVTRVLRPGAVLDLVATPDGGRSRVTSLITLR